LKWSSTPPSTAPTRAGPHYGLLKDGASHTVYTDTATGSPERPISFDQSEVKFRGLVEGAARKISKANADNVVDMVGDLRISTT
jgi:hypothetical protein